ncbi:MAG TPA: matrixin family metalloprotease [Actinomycetota bacterium]|jgi:predicted Zn-dependent protease
MLRVVRVSCCLLFVAFLARGAASGVSSPMVGLTEGSATPVNLRPGMNFSTDGVTVRVPPRGFSVAAEVVGARGRTVELSLETKKDGSVLVLRGAAADPVAMVGSSDNPCGDGAYTLASAKWSRTYAYYVSTANLPSNISARAASADFRSAVSHIVNGYNNCGRDPNLAVGASYQGTISSQVDIASTAGCMSPDGRNELGFRRLPSSYLAVSCRWWSGGRYVEGDTAANTYYKWYVNKPSNCYWRWSLEDVATHELGHVFGLGHVSESSHPRLTMSPMLYPCQSTESTLGLGDLRGLQALY